MDFKENFPVWDKLTEEEQEKLSASVRERKVAGGTLIYDGAGDCAGLFLVRSGRLRAFILSQEGKEVTIYRLFDRDICLFSASCMMRDVQFEISIEAEKDSELWMIPADVYRELAESSAALANYTNRIMAGRFSEVMWLIEQIMWKSFDKRLAGFLVEESLLEGSRVLDMTHDRIASHLGTAREVVTRMLRYFRDEGMVELRRGTVELIDMEGLEEVAG